MRRTLFNTPVITPLMRAVSRVFFRLGGWTVEIAAPPVSRKCVLIGAPHTSNWDLPYTLMAALALELNMSWMAKASLFRGPLGVLMRWMGGIAVDRDRRSNLVASSARALREASGPLQLAVAPEGTRGLTREWRTGFYHIALQAQVPIVLGYMDYGRKRTGLGPEFTPSGDIERDMGEIKAFYAGMRGRRANLFDGQ